MSEKMIKYLNKNKEIKLINKLNNTSLFFCITYCNRNLVLISNFNYFKFKLLELENHELFVKRSDNRVQYIKITNFLWKKRKCEITQNFLIKCYLSVEYQTKIRSSRDAEVQNKPRFRGQTFFI